MFLEHSCAPNNLNVLLCSKIKVWDLQAALDPRSPAGTLCLRTLIVSLLFILVFKNIVILCDIFT